MIREVYFDIDGTLYDYNKGNEAGMACMVAYAEEVLGIGEEEFLESYQSHNRKITKRLSKSNASIHSRSIRLLEMLEDWGKPIFPHLEKLYSLYWDGLIDASAPEAGALDAMEALKSRGIKIGIGTDMTLRMQVEKLKKLGFSPYIDHIVTSQESGWEKPSPQFMALCIEKAGVDPSEIAFVGDSLEKDACGAAAAGMRGIWFNKAMGQASDGRGQSAAHPGGGDKALEPHETGDLRGEAPDIHEIKSFDELVPYIESL